MLVLLVLASLGVDYGQIAAAGLPAVRAGVAPPGRAWVVPREGHWRAPPWVVLCSFAPVDAETLARGLAWWADRGQPSSGISAGDCLDGDPRRGRIWVRLEDAGAAASGGATRLRIGDAGGEDTIEHASVYLPPDPVPWTVLLHELGHAFGHGHVSRAGHVMSRRRADLGLDDAGLVR